MGRVPTQELPSCDKQACRSRPCHTPGAAFLSRWPPAGTGKTTAVVELILQEVARGSRVLACAASNIAVGARRAWPVISGSAGLCRQPGRPCCAFGVGLLAFGACLPLGGNQGPELRSHAHTRPRPPCGRVTRGDVTAGGQPGGAPGSCQPQDEAAAAGAPCAAAAAGERAPRRAALGSSASCRPTCQPRVACIHVHGPTTKHPSTPPPKTHAHPPRCLTAVLRPTCCAATTAHLPRTAGSERPCRAGECAVANTGLRLSPEACAASSLLTDCNAPLTAAPKCPLHPEPSCTPRPGEIRAN